MELFQNSHNFSPTFTHLIKLEDSANNHIILDKINDRFGCTVKIVKDHFGKPSISCAEKLYPYSYSKSNQYQSISFAMCPSIAIGVDIEFIKYRNFGFRKKFMSVQELYFYDSLGSCLTKKLFFYKIFSMKEAIFKARGDGLSADLSSICLLKEMASLDHSVKFKVDIFNLHYALQQIIYNGLYVISLAVATCGRGLQNAKNPFSPRCQ